MDVEDSTAFYAFNWDDYRDKSGAIDLYSVFKDNVATHLPINHDVVKTYLDGISEIHPIKSRQIAAQCLLNAFFFETLCDRLDGRQ